MYFMCLGKGVGVGGQHDLNASNFIFHSPVIALELYVYLERPIKLCSKIVDFIVPVASVQLGGGGGQNI